MLAWKDQLNRMTIRHATWLLSSGCRRWGQGAAAASFAPDVHAPNRCATWGNVASPLSHSCPSSFQLQHYAALSILVNPCVKQQSLDQVCWQSLQCLTAALSNNPSTAPVRKHSSKVGAASASCTSSAKTASIHHALLANQEQQRAIADFTSPAISITAGPGSGKTRVIVARVATLVHQQGVTPKSIAVLTFTRKAAWELQQRLLEVLGLQGQQVFAGTFHSFCIRLLLQYGDALNPGLSRSCRVATEAQALEHMSAALAAVSPNLKGRRFTQQLHSYTNKVSLLKNRSRSTYGLSAAALEDIVRELTLKGVLDLTHEMATTNFLSVLLGYNKALRDGGQLDYDDLLSATVALLRQPGIALRVSDQYPDVLVDEFQDTNVPQYALVDLLTKAGSSIFVVGDADQAIYAWRGAVPQNMATHFDLDNISSSSHRLGCNYRSKLNILTTANYIVRPDHTNNAADAVSATLGERLPLTAAAPLHEVTATSATMHVSSNKISAGLLDAPAVLVESAAAATAKSRVQEAAGSAAVTAAGAVSATAAAAAASAAASAASSICLGQVHVIATMDSNHEAAVAVQHVQQLHQVQGLALHDIAILYRTNIQGEVLVKQLEKECVAHTVCRKGLVRPVDSASAGKITHSKPEPVQRVVDCVQLLTLHAAKGLEFKAVIIVGCSAKLLPHFLRKDQEDIEEDRRLLYVGATRASDVLILTWPSARIKPTTRMKSCAAAVIRENVKWYQRPSPFVLAMLAGMSRDGVLHSTLSYTDKTGSHPLHELLAAAEHTSFSPPAGSRPSNMRKKQSPAATAANAAAADCACAVEVTQSQPITPAAKAVHATHKAAPQPPVAAMGTTAAQAIMTTTVAVMAGSTTCLADKRTPERQETPGAHPAKKQKPAKTVRFMFAPSKLSST